MNRSQQFQLSHLLIGTTLLALLVFLIVRWWQLTVLLGVSILPAILCVICLKRFGKLKPLYAATFCGLVLALLFLLLYVLSAGPAMYLDVNYLTTQAGDSSPTWLVKFYEPLQLLDQPSNPLREPMNEYFHRWAEYSGITLNSGM